MTSPGASGLPRIEELSYGHVAPGTSASRESAPPGQPPNASYSESASEQLSIMMMLGSLPLTCAGSVVVTIPDKATASIATSSGVRSIRIFAPPVDGVEEAGTLHCERERVKKGHASVSFGTSRTSTGVASYAIASCCAQLTSRLPVVNVAHSVT